MTYKITSTQQSDVTLITTVEYNFDGVISTIVIPHFMPKTEAEIEQNIINAAQSELARLNAVSYIQSLIPALSINEEKPIE